VQPVAVQRCENRVGRARYTAWRVEVFHSNQPAAA
jgi:hypothetical protein